MALEDSQTTGDIGSEEPSRAVRVFVYGFLTVFVACGLFSIEFWPLTGWRLFHEIRDGTREGWTVVAVEADGSEVSIDFARLPVAYRNTTKLIGGFDDLTPDERDEICAAWADAAEDRQHVSAGAVRIYRFERPLWTDRDEPRPDATRTLRYTCAAEAP